ncbi:hypothetical protein CTI14_52460, partial [Methylobacterium radiotolerans]
MSPLDVRRAHRDLAAPDDAAAIGLGRKRYSSRDLARPFAGVRSAIEPATFDDRVASYLPRLREGQAFA